MSSSPANSCLLFLSQLRLSPTLFSSYDPYDDMIFIIMTFMPRITAIPSSSQLYATSSSLPSGRWEVVFYSVWFALLALHLWPWRCSQKNKTSFEDINILSFAGLAMTRTVVLRLWPTTLTSAYPALLDGIVVYLIFYYYFSY